MQYQAEVLAQVLRLAQEKALALVQAAPLRLEVEAVLLQREVQAVLRQAVALQQLAALPQVQEVPLLELGVPQVLLEQMEMEIQKGWDRLAQRALAVEQVRAEAGDWVVTQVLKEMVQVPLPEAE